MAADRSFPGSAEPISPEYVSQRGFNTAFRGFEPNEVRQFLGQVADSLRYLRERVAQLDDARREAEDRAAHPQLDDETLVSAMGAETASILRSARAAAVEIRAKAEEDASHVLEDARARADTTRAEAEAARERRLADAEAEAERLTHSLIEEAERTRDTSRAEAEALRAQAEQERRVTVEAAQAIREKILTDLARRRKVATVQIEQLRAGRERLLEAYLVVRRTLDEVTDELQRADAEARLAAETVGRAAAARDTLVDPGPVDLPTLGVQGSGSEGDSTQASRDGPYDPPNGTGAGGSSGGEVAPDAPAAGVAAFGDAAERSDSRVGNQSANAENGRGVERVGVLQDTETAENGRDRASSGRAGAGDRTRPGTRRRAGTGPSATVAEQPGSTEASGATHEVAELAAGSVEQLFARLRADQAQLPEDAEGNGADLDEPTEEELAEAGVRTDEDELLLQRRDDGILEVESGLVRRLKRALQDEQNNLLDRIRNVHGVPTAQSVLMSVEVDQERFATAARPFLERAARAGTTFGRRVTDPDAPEARTAKGVGIGDIAGDLAKAIVEPLRRRIEQAFEQSDDEDPAVLNEALSAAYREWKTQRIETVAGDQVAAAFSRAAFLAVPEGTRLRWVVDDVSGFCPDCDDNVLAGGVLKGEAYPTGQLHPPAHAGCRCVLALASD